MSVLAKRLYDRRLSVENEARAVIQTAHDEKRELTSEENEKLDRLDTESRELVERVQEILEAEERAKAVEDKLSVYGRKEAKEIEPIDQQLRDFLRGKSGRSFEVQAETRDLTTGTGSTPYAGYTVPTTFYGRLMEHLIEVSGLLQAGPTIIRTSGGEAIQIPKTTTHSTASRIAEGATIGESDPVFGQVELNAYKYGHMIQVSRELIDDNAVDLLGYLARQSGRAIGNAMGTDFVLGTGSSQPSGIVGDSTLGETGANSVSGVFDEDDIIDLFHSVISPYRSSPSCGWLMRDATVGAVRKLKDATSGQFLWQPGLQASQPDILLGKPVHTDPNVAAVAASAKSVLFGDFSAYAVRLVGAVRFERSDDYAFNADLVTFRALMRGDGALVDTTGAVKHFVGGS